MKRSFRPMKAFMDKEFMLQSPVAQHLYHTYAADMPICDYHCHILSLIHI